MPRAIASLALFALAIPALPPASSLSVAYLPLDERFATRGAFLNLAAATPFAVDTPPAAAISLQLASE
jgi:hypothetical protein